MRKDEAIDLYGRKVRVKVVGCYNDRTILCDPYYLFYDEAEVYHVENRETRKIVFTFSCNSWTKASEIAMLELHKRNGEDK